MVDEGKGSLYLEGSGERKGFADGEVEAAFSLRLMAPEAGRARSSPEPAEGVLFEVEAGEGKAVSVLDVGGEASGEATIGSEAYTFEMCPLARGHGREVLLEVGEEAKPVDRCLCMFSPEGGIGIVFSTDEAGAAKVIQCHFVLGQGLYEALWGARGVLEEDGGERLEDGFVKGAVGELFGKAHGAEFAIKEGRPKGELHPQ